MKVCAKVTYEISDRMQKDNDRHIYLDNVKVNGVGPYTFIFDTGASVTCISKEIARRHKIRSKSRKLSKGAYSSKRIGMGIVASVSVQKAIRRGIDVAILDLAELSKHLRCRIDGILGHSFLEKFVVTIDYPEQVVTLKRR